MSGPSWFAAQAGAASQRTQGGMSHTRMLSVAYRPAAGGAFTQRRLVRTARSPSLRLKINPERKLLSSFSRQVGQGFVE